MFPFDIWDLIVGFSNHIPLVQSLCILCKRFNKHSEKFWEIYLDNLENRYSTPITNHNQLKLLRENKITGIEKIKLEDIDGILDIINPLTWRSCHGRCEETQLYCIFITKQKNYILYSHYEFRCGNTDWQSISIHDTLYNLLKKTCVKENIKLKQCLKRK